MRVPWFPSSSCFCLAFLLSCSSNHNVSPWIDPSIISSLVVPGRLDRYLAQIDQEMNADGLSLLTESKGAFADNSPFVLRSYVGENAVRSKRFAVRMASNSGVILALGPSHPADLLQPQRSQLKGSLADGGWNSGTDLNGDGLVDIVVSGSDGSFEIWGAHPSGASPYPMDAPRPPNRVLDIDDDGRPDLVSDVNPGFSDNVKVFYVMTFDSGRYRSDSTAVLAFHKALASRLRASLSSSSDAGLVPSDRIGLIVQIAWHELRAAQDPKSVLERADLAVQSLSPLPDGLAQSWVRWRGWLARVVSQ